MIPLIELHTYLNQLLQPSAFQDACHNGIQIEGKGLITTIATAVSASLETIEQAISQKADVLIVHHGLFWNGDSFVIAGSKREKIRKLLLHDITLMAYHLPLDAHQQFGNNWLAAKELGMTDLKPFGIHRGMPIGVCGKLPPTSQEQMQKKLERYYSHPATCVFGGKQTLETLGIVSGGAYRTIGEAAACGLDGFVTDNYDEPAWYSAKEEKINFYALGHSATERIGPRALADHLKDQFKVKSLFIDVENPF